MGRTTFLQPTLLDWSVASRPITGEAVSGDLHLVAARETSVLLAVVDGLGHGPEAYAAARAAIAILARCSHEPILSIVHHCHENLATTRGVVLTLASVQARDNTLTWIGIGNVEGRLVRADCQGKPPFEQALLRGGLVGCQLPSLQASVLPIGPGDLLILATDGIHSGFDSRPFNLNLTPQQIAHRLLDEYYKGMDDGLVLVARYLGGTLKK
jgi:phosphoserine phosphatase RsbX